MKEKEFLKFLDKYEDELNDTFSYPDRVFDVMDDIRKEFKKIYETR